MSSFKPKDLMDLKRGEYFSFTMQVLNNKVPVDVAVENITAQIRNKSGDLIDTCVIERTALGTFKFTVADTNEWPISVLEMDIDINHNGQPFSTTTYLITMVKDITRPVE